MKKLINGNISYSSDDFLKMQQDAVKRVKEMQKKAEEKVLQSNKISSDNISYNNLKNNFSPGNFQNTIPNFKESLGENLNNTVENLSAIPKKALSSLTSVLESFGIDNDKLIIILLILILANDDGDKTLILALAYLLF